MLRNLVRISPLIILLLGPIPSVVNEEAPELLQEKFQDDSPVPVTSQDMHVQCVKTVEICVPADDCHNGQIRGNAPVPPQTDDFCHVRTHVCCNLPKKEDHTTQIPPSVSLQPNQNTPPPKSDVDETARMELILESLQFLSSLIEEFAEKGKQRATTEKLNE